MGKIDFKIKHISSVYKDLPQSPDHNDILYFCHIKKKTSFTINDLLNHFGMDRAETVKASVEYLLKMNAVEKVNDNDFNLIHKLSENGYLQ